NSSWSVPQSPHASIRSRPSSSPTTGSGSARASNARDATRTRALVDGTGTSGVESYGRCAARASTAVRRPVAKILRTNLCGRRGRGGALEFAGQRVLTNLAKNRRALGLGRIRWSARSDESREESPQHAVPRNERIRRISRRIADTGERRRHTLGVTIA